MHEPPYNVLFLCTSNSARSQMGEALLNVLGEGRFRAFSAGSNPAGRLQPLATELIQEFGYPVAQLRSKGWDEFVGQDAPQMDFIITVCDNAANEMCPVWPGHPAFAHWNVPDPARTPGNPHAFLDAWATLRRRIELLVALPLDKLDRLAREQQMRDIAGEPG